MDNQQNEWLTVQDITHVLKVHEESVRRWIRSGELPAILLGSAKGGYRVRRSDFDRFLVEKFGAMGKAATRDSHASALQSLSQVEAGGAEDSMSERATVIYKRQFISAPSRAMEHKIRRSREISQDH